MPLFNKEELTRKGYLVERHLTKAAKSILTEKSRVFSSEQGYDVFLSHSFRDAPLVLGLRQEIIDLGFSVYVDWIEDQQLDRSQVTATTADVLRQRMKACSCLLFATSENSPNSKWMPWELGYFDGIKAKVAILPIAETPTSTETYDGQEYLGLYPYVTKTPSSGSTTPTLWINTDATIYVSLSAWLKGQNPTKHQQ